MAAALLPPLVQAPAERRVVLLFLLFENQGTTAAGGLRTVSILIIGGENVTFRRYACAGCCLNSI
jgi:hypothetical protein